jgi:uncharacterized protein (TIGR03067 family)
MSKVLSILFAALLSASVIVRTDDSKENNTPDPDLRLLQGTWKIQYHETAGNEDTLETLWEMEIKGSEYSLTALGTTTKGTIKLDSSKKPKHLEYTIDDDSETTFFGIYELMGDTYKTCDVQMDKDPRPTEFKTRAKTGQIAIWKKVKLKD